jgi:hypothetical protein
MNAIETETVIHKDKTITLRWFYDDSMGPPWKEHDGHGPVTDWTSRDKRPGEMVLNSDRHSKRYYDFAEAVRIARRDGWDAPPYKTGTPGERAHRAAMRDFEHLKRWCNDSWHWVGYQVKIEGTNYEDSLWGIESDSMEEYTEQAMQGAKDWLDKEEVESAWAAAHEIATAA